MRNLLIVIFFAMIIYSFINVGLSFGPDDCPSSTSYLCRDGSQCIDKAYLCNNITDCPDRDDETDCDMKLCRDGSYFKCRNGERCIAKSLTCDNVADCPDASDESDHLCDDAPERTVTRKNCKPDKEFECELKICIPKELVCDGIEHCSDGRDEETAMCKKLNATCKGFQCDNGQCLASHKWTCDGYKDCFDGSDELHCSPHCELSSGSFLCKSEDECVSLSKVCDGTPDCTDKSDEGGLCNEKDSCKSIQCDGPCQVLPSGATCLCTKGLKFNNVTNKCEDTNECERYGVCSQGCVNTNGSHICTCAKSFRMKSDNRTCAAYGSDPVLVYTNSERIKTIGIYSGSKQLVQKTSQSVGLSYDGQAFYWTELYSGRESIVKYSPGGRKEVLLTAGLVRPEDLAIDWLTGNIYFTDASRSHVAVCSSDGFHCTQLVQLAIMENPRGIVLHPSESLMFWTDWGSSPHIGVAFMDGSGPKVLINNVLLPNGLALDWPNGRIYWVDAQSQTIESSTITGNDRRIVLEDIVKHPFGLAVFESKLYWSDWDRMSIESCDKFTGKNHEVLVQGEQIFDVHIYHEAMLPHQKHACMESSCSHLCLLAFNSSYTCACPENMELLPDRHTCQPNKKPYKVILGIGRHMIVVPYQTFGRYTNSYADDLDHNIDLMEFNSINGEVYIANNKARKILVVDIKKREIFDVVSDHILSIKSMAYDYLANNLYWIDSEKGTIEVYSLNQKKRAVVQHYTGTDKPTALALVPSHGEMFVAINSLDHYHIDKQSMRGDQSHHHIVETGLSKKGPIHFAIDDEKELLYWSDGDGKKIEFSDFNGRNRKVFTRNRRYPGPLALIGEDIFWTSIKSSSLQWRDRRNISETKIVTLERPPTERAMPDLISIIAGTPIKISNHPCMVNNGDCSDICLSDGPTSRVCMCETGHYFKDKANTKCVKRSECGFRCSSSGECLETSHRCDKKVDCLDKSDEANCDEKEKKCDATQFKCRSGQCIPLAQRCDQHYNCYDHSDELACSDINKKEHCTQNQMQCPSGYCLDITQRCDGQDDCGDNFDENLDVCQTIDCPKNFFKCISGQCVPKEFECNGFIDCMDASDEHAECPNPICKPGMRACPKGWCINQKLFCDGHDDCEGGFDEVGCSSMGKVESNVTCDSNEFQCPSDLSKCIDSKDVCNDQPDCPKGEDEKDCPSCPSHMFECANDKCIFTRWVCDKNNDCGDGSDEENCDTPAPKVLETCEVSQFRCRDGSCLDYDKVCDGDSDCKDGDDEGGMCSDSCRNNPCHQKCIKSPKGSICACNEGFQLSNAGDKKCEDINECKTMNPCSQNCINNIGSFRCSCNHNFILSSDKKSCKALGERQAILYSFFDHIRNFTESPRATDIVVDTKGFQIRDFDLNVESKKILFTVVGDDELVEVDMVSGKKISATNIPVSDLIAHDWISGNTYIVHYPDDFRAEIHVCDTKTKACALIQKLNYHEQIPAIQVDPVNKLLFYVKLTNVIFMHPTSSVVKTRLDGTDVKLILNDTHITALALDIDKQQVLLTEMETQSLQMVDYDGSNRQYVAKQTRLLKRPVAMALFENHAFILNRASSFITQCKLYGNKECRQIDIISTNARQILVAQQSTQSRAINNCLNHPCDVVCIPVDLGIKCACSNGTFVASGKQCNEFQVSIVSQESSSKLWLWLLLGLTTIAFTTVIIILYRRRNSHGTFNVSMYFRNNQMSKVFPVDKLPMPLPRSANAASAPTINTLNRNCHEFVSEDFYHSATTLNINQPEVVDYLEDDTEELENVDFSNDQRERLII